VDLSKQSADFPPIGLGFVSTHCSDSPAAVLSRMALDFQASVFCFQTVNTCSGRPKPGGRSLLLSDTHRLFVFPTSVLRKFPTVVSRRQRVAET